MILFSVVVLMVVGLVAAGKGRLDVATWANSLVTVLLLARQLGKEKRP